MAETEGAQLGSVSSPITKRVYSVALDELLAWFRQERRPGGFCKATVSTRRASLELRGLGSSSIIIRMSAIRKLAAEAADNGLIAPRTGCRHRPRKEREICWRPNGNWLSVRQAQNLLNAPDAATLKGLRDRAILSVLLGCGLRRSEVAALTFAHVQQRNGRWCLVDLVWQTWTHPHHANAQLGEGCYRRLDCIGPHRRRPCLSPSTSGRSRIRPLPW